MKLTKSWLDPYLRILRTGTYEIRRLQGSLTANVLMIAPPPTEVEREFDLAWCSAAAANFFDMMRAEVPLTPNEFLIMPASFRLQTTKNFRTADANLGREILAAAAKSSQITGFVCVGSEAFKAYFGFGKKPSMDMLVGTVLRVSQTGYKPLLVFPDMDLLSFDPVQARKEKTLSFRELNQRSAAQRQLIQMFGKRKLFQKLEALCQ